MGEYVEKYFTEEELPYIYKGPKLIKLKGSMVNGKKEGVWIEGKFDDYDYRYYTRINYKEINYINNKKEGKYKEYYKIYKKEGNSIFAIENHKDDYKISTIGNYNNDKKNGEFIYYYGDDEIINCCNYIDDKIEGKEKYYIDEISQCSYYINNKKEGRDTDYYYDPDNCNISYYINGKKLYNKIY
jgi:antitoxin component YwqK of YwqJK toxin-antitoxin module